MRSLTVQIPQPCHERWDAMQPTEQGRFCASCQKTVVDYTTLSDRELVRLLSQPLETTCGRFRDEQLNRPLIASNPVISSGWRRWAGLFTMSLFGWQTVRAQAGNPSRPPSVQHATARVAYSVTTLPIRDTRSADTQWMISGRVMLMDSNATLSPIPGANITIALSGHSWQTQTDSTGTFTLPVHTQGQPAELTLYASKASHLHGRTTFWVAPSTTSIVLNDIILREPTPLRNITGGGLSLCRTPSRWQKFKRKLFH